MSIADPIKRPPPFGKAKFFAVVLGALAGSLTLAIETISSVSDFRAIGATQRILYALLFPGIFASTSLGGEANTGLMWIAAGINAVIYFALAWIACRLTVNIYNR
jgi:hypothetical protein